VRLIVDCDLLVASSTAVAAHADACRALSAGVAGLGDGLDLADGDVRGGLSELSDVCADVLELVAIDLDLVADRMRAGARFYSAVESAAAGEFRRHHP
jgi:hypothetical protein